MTGEFTGALRERIAIEQRISERDICGGAIGGYGYDGAAWAAIEPIAAGAAVEAGARAAMPRWRVTLRRREGISLDSRFVWRGKFLKVRSVESDPARPERMGVICEEQR